MSSASLFKHGIALCGLTSFVEAYSPAAAVRYSHLLARSHVLPGCKETNSLGQNAPSLPPLKI